MDSYYISGRDGDSQQSRSRSNSHLSNATSQFQDLNIKSSIGSSIEEGGASKDGPTTSTSSFLNPEQRHPSATPTLISSPPTPQQSTPFPEFSQADLDSNWLYTEPEDITSTGPTPIVRLDPVQHHPTGISQASNSSVSRSNSFPVNMRSVLSQPQVYMRPDFSQYHSAVGVHQYDARFDAGIQQSYTWPRNSDSSPYLDDRSVLTSSGFDLGDQFVPQQMSPPMAAGTLTPGYDPKLMPMYARSISSSPPRPSLTPEQRELKRQRDVARRDSKAILRRDRSTSNPYNLSPQPSPEMLTRSLSEFSNGLTPSPLLSQGSQGSPNMSNLGSPAYLSGYSPNLGDPSSSDLYGGGFTMASDFGGLPAYAMPYTPGPMDGGLSYMSRPHSLSTGSDQQPNMQHMQSMYQNPNQKMGSSDSADHVRVVHSRPKPQCWEHGCNGRQFSTFSNLLRHQREKSGVAQKSSCPNCGAEFTRTTARNGHMAHEKCKQRRAS